MAIAKKEPTSDVVTIKKIERGALLIPIIGESHLIVHKWTEKAKREMRDKHTGADKDTVKSPRPNKVPEQDAYDSTYWMPDGRGAMPAIAFKAAMVGACRLIKGLTLVNAKTALFVKGEGPEMLVPIDGEYEMREDMPRNASHTPDLRYRNYFFPWSCTLEVHYLKSLIKPASVINLVEAAGLGGVGDWRPSSPYSLSGMFGMFRVDESRDIVELR